MKRQVLAVALSLFVTSISLASFPVENASKEKSTKANTEVVKETPTVVVEKSTPSSEKKVEKAQEKLNKKVAKVQAKQTKNSEKSGDDSTIAIILAIVSVVFLPFALHNWYLGRKKIALWQTLMVFPGFILLLLPLIASWIWQLVDLIRLLINGSLPS